MLYLSFEYPALGDLANVSFAINQSSTTFKQSNQLTHVAPFSTRSAKPAQEELQVHLQEEGQEEGRGDACRGCETY
jgi:hypothetical protein